MLIILLPKESLRRMKIIFFGTPDFAIPSLRKLYESENEIAAVVTAPDKERGRGRKVTFTPVKEFAVENGIPVLQPENLKSENFADDLKNFNADLFVIVAFRILPESVFMLPRFGSFNLHGSLLPKYRGAAPIQWALINGDKVTGVTTFFLERKVDTGNIILQREVEILPEDDFGSLHDKMSETGADVVLETVNLIKSGNVELKRQDSSLASKAPKITKELAQINWNEPADKIVNLVRGLSPFPGAYFILNGKIYKVYKARGASVNLAPGQIKETKREIFVGAGNDSSVEILDIKPEGRKRMSADEFLRGYSLTEETK